MDTLLEFHEMYPLPTMFWFCLRVLVPPIGKNRTNVWDI